VYKLTIGVDNWEDVEVVFVQKGLRKVIAGLVAVNELLGNVFQSLCTISITVLHMTRPRTGATIHSRACTVPCQRMAGFPGPSAPHMWILTWMLAVASVACQ
jgi:hypothetical protein